MKKMLFTTLCSLLALSALAQTPLPATPPANPTLAPATTPALTASAPPSFTVPPVTTTPIPNPAPAINAVTPAIPVVTPSPTSTPDADDQIDDAIEKKISRHFDFSTGHHHSDDDMGDYGWMAVPIVGIVFLCVFGAPVLIVAVILFFSLSRNRAMHKTVRMMVEKGQPVPESLINPPPVVRQRSDLRRGIKWMLWGVGIMIFLGACSDWDGGAWSLGIIPFLIGIAYLIFWRLDLRSDETLPKV